MPLDAAGHLLWWEDRVIIPAIFLLLGAIVGFLSTRVSLWLDRRRAKLVFLEAIRLELAGLLDQFNASLTEVEGSINRLQRREPSPPQLVGTLRTTVFTSQLGTLPDLSDPLLIDIVRFYSDVPVWLQIITSLGGQAQDLRSRDDGSAQQAQRINQVLSTVLVLNEQLNGYSRRARGLIERIDKAQPPRVSSPAA